MPELNIREIARDNENKIYFNWIVIILKTIRTRTNTNGLSNDGIVYPK